MSMISREIAELVEARHNDVVATIERLFQKGLLRSSRKTRRHDNVKIAIERLAVRGVIQLPALQEVKNHLGQTVSVYQLEKRDS